MIKKSRVLMLFLDIAVISVVLYLFIRLQYLHNYVVKLEVAPSLYEIIDAHYKAYFLLIISWIFISDRVRFYNYNRFLYLRELIKKIGIQLFLFIVLLFTISGIKEDPLLSTEYVVLISFILLIYLFTTRLIVFYYKKYYNSFDKNQERIVVFGRNSNTEKLVNKINERKDFGLKVAYVIEANYIDFLKNNPLINKVFISQNSIITPEEEKDIVLFCENLHKDVYFIPNSFLGEILRLNIEYIDTFPIYNIKKYPLELKVLFDFIFASLVCVFLLSWLFPLIALLIKLDSKGPIFFKQERMGLNGRPFHCYKFRTMRNDGTNSIKATVVNDNRVTKIGSFLRKTSLDELPQFLNVLLGDMSIVGPRPHMLSQDKFYSEIILKYNLRNYVKPGITGLAQVKGYRGAIDCDKDMEDRIRTDIFYVRNWSILLDIQILYQTIVLVLKGDENAI